MLPGKEHLFRKHLSKHSVGAYMELCQEVGVSFEAVPAKHIHLSRPEAGFTARIEELRAENARLTRELDRSRDRAARELSSKQGAQEEIDHLKARIQLAETDNRQLQEDIQKWRLAADYFKNSAAKSSHGVSEMFSVLEKLKHELPFLSDHEDRERMFSGASKAKTLGRDV